MELNSLYNYTAYLLQKLLCLSPRAVQCFANLCIERLLLATKVSSPKVADEIQIALHAAWNHLAKDDLPTPNLSHIDILQELLEVFLDTDESSDRWNIVEDTVYAAQGMLRHLHSCDPVDGARCGNAVFNAVTQVVRYMQATQYTFVIGYEVMWATPLIQSELQQQQQTIQRLKTGPSDKHELQQLRKEAQKQGDKLLNQLYQYEEKMNAQWWVTKTKYHVGDTVQGYIQLFHPAGIVVKLGEHTYGILGHDVSGILPLQSSHFQHRNLTATVIGYDDTNQRILLGAPNYHDSSAPQI